jgi:hypothetical protein
LLGREEDSNFGQYAAIYQLVGVLGGAVALSLLFGLGISSIWLSVPLWAMLAFSIFLFILPGHGLIYGPHLWLLVIVDMLLSFLGIQRRRPGERDNNHDA